MYGRTAVLMVMVISTRALFHTRPSQYTLMIPKRIPIIGPTCVVCVMGARGVGGVGR